MARASSALFWMADASDKRITFTHGSYGKVERIADDEGSGRTLTVTWPDGRISMVQNSLTPVTVPPTLVQS